LSLVKRGAVSCCCLYAYFYDTPLSVPSYGAVAHNPEHRLTAAPARDLIKTTKRDYDMEVGFIKENFHRDFFTKYSTKTFWNSHRSEYHFSLCFRLRDRMWRSTIYRGFCFFLSILPSLAV